MIHSRAILRSRSPICDFDAGTDGASAVKHEPIRRAMEEVEDEPCRHLVQDGKFTDEATPADRVRLGPRMGIKFTGSKALRKWAAGVAGRKGRKK